MVGKMGKLAVELEIEDANKSCSSASRVGHERI